MDYYPKGSPQLSYKNDPYKYLRKKYNLPYKSEKNFQKSPINDNKLKKIYQKIQSDVDEKLNEFPTGFFNKCNETKVPMPRVNFNLDENININDYLQNVDRKKKLTKYKTNKPKNSFLSYISNTQRHDNEDYITDIYNNNYYYDEEEEISDNVDFYTGDINNYDWKKKLKLIREQKKNENFYDKRNKNRSNSPMQIEYQNIPDFSNTNIRNYNKISLYNRRKIKEFLSDNDPAETPISIPFSKMLPMNYSNDNQYINFSNSNDDDNNSYLSNNVIINRTQSPFYNNRNNNLNKKYYDTSVSNNDIDNDTQSFKLGRKLKKKFTDMAKFFRQYKNLNLSAQDNKDDTSQDTSDYKYGTFQYKRPKKNDECHYKQNLVIRTKKRKPSNEKYFSQNVSKDYETNNDNTSKYLDLSNSNLSNTSNISNNKKLNKSSMTENIFYPKKKIFGNNQNFLIDINSSTDETQFNKTQTELKKNRQNKKIKQYPTNKIYYPHKDINKQMSLQSTIANKGRILLNNRNNKNYNKNNNNTNIYVRNKSPNNFYNYNTEKNNNEYTDTYTSNNSYNTNSLLIRSPIKYLCVDKYPKNQIMTQGNRYKDKNSIQEIQVDLSPKQNINNKNINNIVNNLPNLSLNSPTSSVIESCIIVFDKKKNGNLNSSVDNLKLPKNSPKSKKQIYVNKKKILHNSYDNFKYDDDVEYNNKYNDKYIKKRIQKNNNNNNNYNYYNNINLMSSGIYEIPINNDISNNNKIYQKPEISPEKNDYDYGKVQNYCAPSPNYAFNYNNINDNYENYSENNESSTNNLNEVNVTFDKNVNLMNSNYNLNNKISAANGHINPKTGIYMKKNKTNSNILNKKNNIKINNITPFGNYINLTPTGKDDNINIRSTIQNEHSFYEIIYNYFTKLPKKKKYYMSKNRLKIIKKPVNPLCYIEKYKQVYKLPFIDESYYTKIKIPNQIKLPSQNICFIQKMFINKNKKDGPQKISKIKKKVVIHKMMNVNYNKKNENQNVNNNNPNSEINNKNIPIIQRMDNFPKNNLYIRGKFKTQKVIRLEKPKDNLNLNININQEISNKESQILNNKNIITTNSNFINNISNTSNSLSESQFDNISSNKHNINKSATENNYLNNLSSFSNTEDDQFNKTMNLFNPRKKIKNIKIKTSVRISRNSDCNKSFQIQKKKTITKDNNNTKLSSNSLLLILKDNEINKNENIFDIVKKEEENKTSKQKKKEAKIKSIIMEDVENYLNYSESLEKKNEKINTVSKKINYDWSMIEQLIIKIKQDLIDIINNYLNACVNLVDSKEKVIYANEYIQIIIDYYIKHYLTKTNLNIIRNKLLCLLYKLEEVNIDNRFKYDVLGKLFLGLLKEGLFFINDYNLFVNCEEEIQTNLAKLARYIILDTEEEQEARQYYLNFKVTKLFLNNPIFFKFVTKFLKENLKC